jgi:hypothetical protein
MQKFVTISLQCQDVTHGAVEEHLSEILAEGWRVTSVTGIGASSGSSPVLWLAIVLEKGINGMAYPDSAAGNPVEASEVYVDEDTTLDVGSRVLSFSQERWWRAEVIGIEDDGRVKIHYPGWGSEWDVVVAREELQVDLSADEEEEE